MFIWNDTINVHIFTRLDVVVIAVVVVVVSCLDTSSFSVTELRVGDVPTSVRDCSDTSLCC